MLTTIDKLDPIINEAFLKEIKVGFGVKRESGLAFGDDTVILEETATR